MSRSPSSSIEPVLVPQGGRAMCATLWGAVLGQPDLSDAALSAVLAWARWRHLASGDVVFACQQPAEQLFAVLEGCVGLGTLREGQAFHLERSVHGPGWLDLSSAWVGQGHVQDAQAMGSALVLELPLAALRPLFLRYPELQERLLLALAQTVQKLTGATHDLMAKDAQKRLVGWLLQRMSAPAGDVALRERKRELAAQLAITPETLSRLLRQLMASGLIEVQGYSIKLLNLNALRALA
ncbi:Crp/Fnr family transcriptional regulator [Roseateles koreensis]|uniref:Crp/Fnr family transcriptional regulator n=1 Tax=Roseateles koreensis TaxID=2987526 RepID=A0ABT5KP95_9BURK|nr:Crp/Fnr family transcriptional regulator [Roseateles koreensis]MDC8784738.1 Crp/Fnr family transcriptional regulator [Roseateles koreensis]